MSSGPPCSGVTQLALRDEVRATDEHAVREIVVSTGMFSEAEVEVAVELVQERLRRGPISGYLFVFAELDGRVIGYTCYGPIACTTASFDLYWIAVHHDHQGKGIGQALLRATEQRIADAGGRRIYIETSCRDRYAPSRAFYERCGYVCEATLRDFYSPGDHKAVYVKVLSSEPTAA